MGARRCASSARERRGRPKAWGAAKGGSGDLWVVRNTSERPITLDHVDVAPIEAATLLEVDGDRPRTFKAGAQFHFWARARLTLGIREVTLVWRVADADAPTHRSSRTISSFVSHSTVASSQSVTGARAMREPWCMRRRASNPHFPQRNGLDV